MIYVTQNPFGSLVLVIAMVLILPKVPEVLMVLKVTMVLVVPKVPTVPKVTCFLGCLSCWWCRADGSMVYMVHGAYGAQGVRCHQAAEPQELCNRLPRACWRDPSHWRRQAVHPKRHWGLHWSLRLPFRIFWTDGICHFGLIDHWIVIEAFINHWNHHWDPLVIGTSLKQSLRCIESFHNLHWPCHWDSHFNGIHKEGPDDHYSQWQSTRKVWESLWESWSVWWMGVSLTVSMHCSKVAMPVSMKISWQNVHCIA